ncbi:MAG: glycosyltransferase, partial [Planctomycetota bacterium]
LMHPSDGRFHGRLGALNLTTEYFPREKPESYWKALQDLGDGGAPGLASWQEPVDFLRRHEIPKDLDMLMRAALIAARAKEQGIQHIHAHFATISTRMAALVNMLTGIPFSFTAHAKDIFRTTVNRELFRELVERAAFAITVSDFNRRYILEKTPGVDAEKVVRLYNGIDLSFFAPPEPRDPPKAPHIVSIGRLVPKKGFHHLLRSLHLAKERGLVFRATIIGEGEQMEGLLGLREELGLSGEVEFPGALPQEEVRRVLRDSTMMALACVPDTDGNMDALPTVLLEALALDLPMVSTTLTGVPEIVGDEAGHLGEPGEELGFAEAMISLWYEIRGGRRRAGICRARGERLFDLRRNASVLRERFLASARKGSQV